MEQEIARRLPDYLFERGIEYHARRRFRNWCDCSYCIARKQATAGITFGTQRFVKDTLVPGYRVRKGYIVSARCWCTDGCPEGCRAVNDPFPVYHDFEWRRLPPCDSLDEAIRNRQERVREQLRVGLRRTLRDLREDHLPPEKKTQSVKRDFDLLFYGNKLKGNGHAEQHRNQPADAGTNRPTRWGTSPRAGRASVDGDYVASEPRVHDPRFREAHRAIDDGPQHDRDDPRWGGDLLVD